MSRKANWVLAAAFVAFVGFVIYSSLPAGGTRCEVCVVFNGLRNCASAHAANAVEAERAAQTTACATLSGGVTDGIACGNALPVSRTCTPPP